MNDAPETRFQVRRWFVETGWADGNGIGIWEATQNCVPVSSQAEAEALRDEWLASGALVKTHWGELRPPHPYGLFRIRNVWEDAGPEALAKSPHVQALVAEAKALLARSLALLNEPVVTHRDEDWIARRRRINAEAAAIREVKP